MRTLRYALVDLTLVIGLAVAACHGRQGSALGEGTSFHVGAGYPRTFNLPDGSTVVLNPGTSVFVAKGFGKDNRVMELDGEAVFDVVGMPGRPFIVHTRDMVVEVLDSAGGSARFHAEAYRSKPGEEVDLLEGRLRAKKSYHSDTDNEPETLGAGEMVMINHDIDLMEKEKLSAVELEKLKGK